MLSCVLRFLSAGSGVVGLCTTGVVADGAGETTAAAAGFRVASGALSRRATCTLSTPVAVCGVDAVETGGAPLLTDSGPQPIAVPMTTSESARRTILRVIEGNMTKEDL